MVPKLKVAVYLTVIGCLLLFVGWLIPYWFARRYGNDTKTEWGLFYSIVCELGRCQTVGGTLASDSVDFIGGEGTVELFAIPILATMSFGLALVATIICLLVYNKCICCYIRKFYLSLSVVVLITTSVLFTLITIVIAAVASGQFFQHQPISSVIEVPWSLLCYCVGEIFLICSDVLLILTIRSYLMYRRLKTSSEKSNSGVYPISLRYYPGKYTKTPDNELHIRAPFYVNTGYEFDHFGTGSGVLYEPPPDYDKRALVRKHSNMKHHHPSNVGYRRIPRRYRHPHDIVIHDHIRDNNQIDLSNKIAHNEVHFSDRKLPIEKDIQIVNETKKEYVYEGKRYRRKPYDRKGDIGKTSTFTHRQNHHPDGKSSSSSDAALSDYQMKVTDRSPARSVTSTAIFSDKDQYLGTIKTDISGIVSLWYSPRDYGTLTYAGKHETKLK